MLPVGLDVIGMVVFFSIVGILLVVDRKNIEFSSGFSIRRWKHGRRAMDKIIFSHRKFFSIMGTIGVILSLIISIGVVGIIVYSSITAQQSLYPILPTVEGFEYPTNAIIGVPFWFWIVAIFTVLIVHEPMHAIFSRLAGVPVRNWGMIFLLVLPIGAFVDPDMKKVHRLSLMKKLRVFAGGSLGNFITGAVFGILFLTITATVFSETLQIHSVSPGTSVEEAGIEGRLVSVDGIETKTIKDLSGVLVKTPGGSQIEIITDKGAYQIETASHPSGSGSYLGLSFLTLEIKPEYVPWSDFILTVRELFKWLFIFNIGIGMFNIMPVRILDGGYIYESIFQKILKSKKKARTLINITSIAIIGLIIFNIVGTNLIGLLS